jgi:hypothetical protein
LPLERSWMPAETPLPALGHVPIDTSVCAPVSSAFTDPSVAVSDEPERGSDMTPLAPSVEKYDGAGIV